MSLSLLGSWLGIWCALGPVAAEQAALSATQTPTLTLVTLEPDGPVARGVRLAAEEAVRTASLLGLRFALEELPPSAIDQVPEHAGVILVDLDPAATCELGDALSTDRTAAIYLRIAEKTCCERMLQVRVPASRRARMQDTAQPEKPPAARLEEWHSSLERFGAEQLNQRYTRATGEPMDSESWAGWVGAKIASEILLRMSLNEPARLRGPSAPAFDGHKGVPLRFDEAGVLMQPMYLVTPGASPPVLREIR